MAWLYIAEDIRKQTVSVYFLSVDSYKISHDLHIKQNYFAKIAILCLAKWEMGVPFYGMDTLTFKTCLQPFFCYSVDCTYLYSLFYCVVTVDSSTLLN